MIWPQARWWRAPAPLLNPSRAGAALVPATSLGRPPVAVLRPWGSCPGGRPAEGWWTNGPLFLAARLPARRAQGACVSRGSHKQHLIRSVNPPLSAPIRQTLLGTSDSRLHTSFCVITDEISGGSTASTGPGVARGSLQPGYTSAWDAPSPAQTSAPWAAGIPPPISWGGSAGGSPILLLLLPEVQLCRQATRGGATHSAAPTVLQIITTAPGGEVPDSHV